MVLPLRFKSNVWPAWLNVLSLGPLQGLQKHVPGQNWVVSDWVAWLVELNWVGCARCWPVLEWMGGSAGVAELMELIVWTAWMNWLAGWLGCLGGLGWTGWPGLLNSHRRPSLKDPIAASLCAAHCNPWTKWQSQCSAKHPLPPIKENRSPTHAGTRVGPLEPHPKQNNTNEQKTICKAAQACLEKAQGTSRCTRPLRCARGPVGRAWPHYWGIGPPIIQGYGFIIVAPKRK